MAQATIYKEVSRKKLLGILPKAYAEQLPKKLNEPVTSIQFSNKVVTGRMVKKVLKDLGDYSSRSLIWSGAAFTYEARQIIEPTNSIMLTTSSEAMMWTDESYVDIKTLIATHVKRPSLPLGTKSR